MIKEVARGDVCQSFSPLEDHTVGVVIEYLFAQDVQTFIQLQSCVRCYETGDENICFVLGTSSSSPFVVTISITSSEMMRVDLIIRESSLINLYKVAGVWIGLVLGLLTSQQISPQTGKTKNMQILNQSTFQKMLFAGSTVQLVQTLSKKQ